MATIEDTLADVKAKKVTAAAALKEEQASDVPRPSLVSQLEALVATEADTPKPKAGVGINPSTKNDATVAKATDSKSPYETVKVKVSKKVLDNTGGLGAFYDPESKKTIGKEAVSVPATPHVEAWLRNQELVRG